MTPTEIIRDAILGYDGTFAENARRGAAEAVADLRAAGWIIVRHDAIALAQAHAREWSADNDNHETKRVESSWTYNKDGAIIGGAGGGGYYD